MYHLDHCFVFLFDTFIGGEGRGDLFPFMDVFWSISSDLGFYLMSMCSVSLSEIHSVSQLNDGKPKLIEIFCGLFFCKYICVLPK